MDGARALSRANPEGAVYNAAMTAPSAPHPPLADVRVGVAGWSYPDWRGRFYPRGQKPQDELRFVSELFDAVELNTTFYRVPDRKLVERWAKAVEDRPGFLFTSKVPKELTHEAGLDAAAIAALSGELLESLAPLAEAGRLAALLLQFPFYFRDSPESRERIRRLVTALRPLPAVVELRSRSFFFGRKGSEADEAAHAARGAVSPPLETGPGSAIRLLEELGAGLANIDLPHSPGSVPPMSVNTSGIGYVRLHGRNSRTWFDPKAGRDEKYDYMYSLEELREWTPRIERLAARTQSTFVIANNHFRGQAPATALLLLHLLGREPAAVPAELLGAIPELAAALERSAGPSGHARAAGRAPGSAR